MEIEAQPGELALARLQQRPFGFGVAGKQRVALDQRGEHRSGLAEQRSRALTRARFGAAHDGRPRRLPVTHRQRDQQPTAVQLGLLARDQLASQLLRAP